MWFLVLTRVQMSQMWEEEWQFNKIKEPENVHGWAERLKGEYVSADKTSFPSQPASIFVVAKEQALL
jgi:hypothetical protein